MKVNVEAVFQVISLQGYSFVKQLFPLLSEDSDAPSVRVPEQATLHFVITFRLTAAVPPSEPHVELQFYEQFKLEGLELPHFQYIECMGQFAQTDTSEAIAYSTVPSPSASLANAANQKIKLTLCNADYSETYFELELPFKMCKLRAKTFNESVGEFGVLMDLTSTPFSWLPLYTERNIEDEDDVDLNMSLKKMERLSVVLDEPPIDVSFNNENTATGSDTHGEVDDGIEPVADDFSEVPDCDAHDDSFEFIEEDLEDRRLYSSTPEDPQGEEDRAAASASLMHQVGSLLIGSRVGQMVVTAGASAVSVSEFDAARIRSRYTCSPIYMLGVEYRMLGPRNQKSVFIDSPAYLMSLKSDCNVEKVRVMSNGYSTVINRTITGDPTIRKLVSLTFPIEKCRELVDMYIKSLNPPTPQQWRRNVLKYVCKEWTLTCKLDKINHSEHGDLTLLDMHMSLNNEHGADEKGIGGAYTCFSNLLYSLSNYSQIIYEILNIQLSCGSSFQVIPIALTGQIIPHGKKARGWRKMEGQVYVWDRQLLCWLLYSLKITNSNCLSLQQANRKLDFILSKCKLARSGDASGRLALIFDGSTTILRTFNSDDFALLSRILDAQCVPFTGSLSASSAEDKSSEWMEQNSGIIGEFLYDFQSRFWFTYRRAFERIGGSSTFLSTDAGWGCMLRTGQSMMAEAMSRVLLGRGTLCYQY